MKLLISVFALSLLLPTCIASVICSGTALCCPKGAPGGKFLQLQQRNEHQILCTYGVAPNYIQCGYNPATGTALTPGPACPPDLTPGSAFTAYCPLRYELRSGVDSKKCVNTQNPVGSTVRIWDCDSRNNQRFLFYQDITSEIRVAGTNHCLEPDTLSPAPGTQVKVKTCNSDNNQKWHYSVFTNRIEHRSGLYLNLQNGDTSNGNPLNLQPWENNLKQIWRTYQ